MSDDVKHFVATYLSQLLEEWQNHQNAPDMYARLGLPMSASLEEINARYAEMSQALIRCNPRCFTVAKQLNEAYGQLKTNDKIAEYTNSQLSLEGEGTKSFQPKLLYQRLGLEGKEDLQYIKTEFQRLWSGSDMHKTPFVSLATDYRRIIYDSDPKIAWQMIKREYGLPPNASEEAVRDLFDRIIEILANKLPDKRKAEVMEKYESTRDAYLGWARLQTAFENLPHNESAIQRKFGELLKAPRRNFKEWHDLRERLKEDPGDEQPLLYSMLDLDVKTIEDFVQTYLTKLLGEWKKNQNAPDMYARLGLPMSAKPGEIKARYDEMVQALTTCGKPCDALKKQVQEAYERLEEKRTQYDRDQFSREANGTQIFEPKLLYQILGLQGEETLPEIKKAHAQLFPGSNMLNHGLKALATDFRRIIYDLADPIIGWKMRADDYALPINATEQEVQTLFDQFRSIFDALPQGDNRKQGVFLQEWGTERDRYMEWARLQKAFQTLPEEKVSGFQTRLGQLLNAPRRDFEALQKIKQELQKNPGDENSLLYTMLGLDVKTIEDFVQTYLTKLLGEWKKNQNAPEMYARLGLPMRAKLVEIKTRYDEMAQALTTCGKPCETVAQQVKEAYERLDTVAKRNQYDADQFSQEGVGRSLTPKLLYQTLGLQGDETLEEIRDAHKEIFHGEDMLYGFQALATDFRRIIYDSADHKIAWKMRRDDYALPINASEQEVQTLFNQFQEILTKLPQDDNRKQGVMIVLGTERDRYMEWARLYAAFQKLPKDKVSGVQTRLGDLFNAPRRDFEALQKIKQELQKNPGDENSLLYTMLGLDVKTIKDFVQTYLTKLLGEWQQNQNAPDMYARLGLPMSAKLVEIKTRYDEMDQALKRCGKPCNNVAQQVQEAYDRLDTKEKIYNYTNLQVSLEGQGQSFHPKLLYQKLGLKGGETLEEIKKKYDERWPETNMYKTPFVSLATDFRRIIYDSDPKIAWQMIEGDYGLRTGATEKDVKDLFDRIKSIFDTLPIADDQKQGVLKLYAFDRHRYLLWAKLHAAFQELSKDKVSRVQQQLGELLKAGKRNFKALNELRESLIEKPGDENPLLYTMLYLDVKTIEDFVKKYLPGRLDEWRTNQNAPDMYARLGLPDNAPLGLIQARYDEMAKALSKCGKPCATVAQQLQEAYDWLHNKHIPPPQKTVQTSKPLRFLFPPGRDVSQYLIGLPNNTVAARISFDGKAIVYVDVDGTEDKRKMPKNNVIDDLVLLELAPLDKILLCTDKFFPSASPMEPLQQYLNNISQKKFKPGFLDKIVRLNDSIKSQQPSQEDRKNDRSSQEDRRSSQEDRRSSQEDRRSSQEDRRSSQEDRRSSQDDWRSSQDDWRSSQDDWRSSQDDRKVCRFLFENFPVYECLFGLPPDTVLAYRTGNDSTVSYMDFQDTKYPKFPRKVEVTDRNLIRHAPEGKVLLSTDKFNPNANPPGDLKAYLQKLSFHRDPGFQWISIRKRILQRDAEVCPRATAVYHLDLQTWALSCVSVAQQWILDQPLVRTIPKKLEQLPLKILFNDKQLPVSDRDRFQWVMLRTWVLHWLGAYRLSMWGIHDLVKPILQRLRSLLKAGVLILKHPLQVHAMAQRHEGQVFMLLDFARPLYLQMIMYDPAEPGMVTVYHDHILQRDTTQNAWLDAFNAISGIRQTQISSTEGVETVNKHALKHLKGLESQYTSWYQVRLRGFLDSELVERQQHAGKVLDKIIRKGSKEQKAMDDSTNAMVPIVGVEGALSESDIRKYCRAVYPNHPYPAFSVQSGQIQPMCGNDGWATATPPHPEDMPFVKALHEMTNEWCSKPAQVVQLWRWLGLSCLSASEIRTHLRTMFGRKALESDEFRKEVVASDLDEFADSIRTGRDVGSTKDCLQRITFAYEMFLSGIYFPFIENRLEAEKIAKLYPDMVVVYPHWADPGMIQGLQFKADSFQMRETDALHLMHPVYDYWKASSRVRLWVFEQFEGALVAPSLKWLKHIRSKCTVATSTPIHLLPLISLLPDHLGTKVRQLASDPSGGAQLGQYTEMASVFASQGLKAYEIDLFRMILAAEKRFFSVPEERPQVLASLHKEYLQRFTGAQELSALRLEVLNLCHRPEFMPYLREKYAKSKEVQVRKEPSATEIKSMTRNQICAKWLGLNRFDARIDLSSILLPTEAAHFYDDHTIESQRMLDIYTKDANRAQEIDVWLKEHYGVTLTDMQRYNPKKPRQMHDQRIQMQANRNAAAVAPAASPTIIYDPNKSVRDAVDLIIKNLCVSEVSLKSKALHILVRMKRFYTSFLPNPPQLNQLVEYCRFLESTWRQLRNETELNMTIEEYWYKYGGLWLQNHMAISDDVAPIPRPPPLPAELTPTRQFVLAFILACVIKE
jgi:hypothetical protein